MKCRWPRAACIGLADLAIESGGEGFDEDLYPRIAAVAGVAVASPVVEVEAKLADRRGSLTLLGIDAFRSRQLQPSLAALAGIDVEQRSAHSIRRPCS